MEEPDQTPRFSRGARCVAGVGVDVLRGDVQRVLFADIPQELHRAG
jgi:hypothetical protein